MRSICYVLHSPLEGISFYYEYNANTLYLAVFLCYNLYICCLLHVSFGKKDMNSFKKVIVGLRSSSERKATYESKADF